ncbi:hypothetical protein [Paraburkholderia ultramafica]|nr:hypothetical protein [Paraburkholderia ultramafica]
MNGHVISICIPEDNADIDISIPINFRNHPSSFACLRMSLANPGLAED